MNFQNLQSSYNKSIVSIQPELNAVDETIIRIEFSPLGEILNVNKNFMSTFCINSDEIVGSFHNSLMFEEDLANLKKNLFWENLLKGVPQKDDEFRRKGKGGNELWLRGSYIPFKNKEEIVYKIILICYDVTDLKNALNSLENIKYALDQSAIVATTDNKGRITYVNDKFSEISKYSKEELLGQDHRILNSGYHSKDFIKDIWRTIANGNVWRGEIKNKAKDDTFYWVDTTIVPFINSKGKPFHYIAIRYDITNRKELEISLENAKMQAENSSKAKEAFLANMSHEIRTPLNAIIGFTNLLKEKSLDLESSKYVKAVSIASKNLLALINDILDISKIEEGKIELEKEPISIKMLVQDIITLNSHSAKAKDIKLISTIDNEIPEFVLGDSTRLSQILVNLIGNALKFTPKGRVELRVLTEEVNNHFTTISFAVIDTGIGIPKNKQIEIFDRFTQAEESTTREFGGTGLGLNIVKRLVSLYGSEINLKSEINKGTEFSFQIKFPLISPSEIAKAKILTKNITSNPLEGLKILIAEDNVFNQILASTYITRNKGEVDIADNGQLAIEMVQKNNYDCILMDVQMPKLDGFQATEYIRNELNMNIPIVACTAHSLAEEKSKSFTVGMNDYITKPYLEEHLVNTLLKHVNKSNFITFENNREIPKLENFYSILSAFETEMGAKAYDSIIRLFKTRIPIDIQDLEEALRKEQISILKDKAHFLAGNFGGLGFKVGFELAKQIENESDNMAFSEIKSLVIQLIAYLNDIRVFLNK